MFYHSYAQRPSLTILDYSGDAHLALGMEPRALCMLSTCSTGSTPIPAKDRFSAPCHNIVQEAGSEPCQGFTQLKLLRVFDAQMLGNHWAR
jgi:hypothetical protein